VDDRADHGGDCDAKRVIDDAIRVIRVRFRVTSVQISNIDEAERVIDDVREIIDVRTAHIGVAAEITKVRRGYIDDAKSNTDDAKSNTDDVRGIIDD
jgi:hypothetical protein